MAKNAAREILQQMLSLGYTARVYYDGDLDTLGYEGTSFDTSWDAVTACDCAIVQFRKEDWEPEVMFIVNEGNVDPEETAADFTAHGNINEIWESLQ